MSSLFKQENQLFTGTQNSYLHISLIGLVISVKERLHFLPFDGAPETDPFLISEDGERGFTLAKTDRLLEVFQECNDDSPIVCVQLSCWNKEAFLPISIRSSRPVRPFIA